MEQTFINWILGCFGALLGFLLHSVWQAVKDLQGADSKLAEKVSAIEVLVAGDYVRRSELDNLMTRLFTKLDVIEDKINTKMDR